MLLRIARLTLCAMLCLTLCACGEGAQYPSGGEVSVTQQEEALPSTPCKKPGGGKYRIAYVDINEYEPTSNYVYQLLLGLKKLGWVEFDRLPFGETVDAKQMVRLLSQMDLGPYLEFVEEASYYLEYEDNQQVAQSLTAQADTIDLILAMGTSPGLFVKALGLSVPTLVCMATDPVQSGIINSAGESGNPYIWAQVEPLAYSRQIKFYHTILPFTHIGMVVYGDEIVAGVPDYQRGAQELGIRLSKRVVSVERGESQEALDAYYEELMRLCRQLAEEGVDAYLINADLITDSRYIPKVLDIFYARGIPVFVQDGENYVRDGALLLVSASDFEGYGMFAAQTMGRVFNGAQAGTLPCEYISSPYLSINLQAAKRIGFKPSFDLLLSCESIYSGGGEEG